VSWEDEPLATLPGYTESAYDPAILLRREWYCIISSPLPDRLLHAAAQCTPHMRVHYDLEHVRRTLEYDFRWGKAKPFERRHIFKLLLPEDEAWPMSPKEDWRYNRWRKAEKAYPIVFVETVTLSRKKNLALTEKQILRGG